MILLKQSYSVNLIILIHQEQLSDFPLDVFFSVHLSCERLLKFMHLEIHSVHVHHLISCCLVCLFTGIKIIPMIPRLNVVSQKWEMNGSIRHVQSRNWGLCPVKVFGKYSHLFSHLIPVLLRILLSRHFILIYISTYNSACKLWYISFCVICFLHLLCKKNY